MMKNALYTGSEGTNTAHKQDEGMEDAFDRSSDIISFSSDSTQFYGDATEVAALRRTDDEEPTLDDYIWEDERALLGKAVRIYWDKSHDVPDAEDFDNDTTAVEAIDGVMAKEPWAKQMSLIGVVEDFITDRTLQVRLHPGRMTVGVDKGKVIVIETPLGRPDWALDNDAARLYRDSWERYQQNIEGDQNGGEGQHVWAGPTVAFSE